MIFQDKKKQNLNNKMDNLKKHVLAQMCAMQMHPIKLLATFIISAHKILIL